MWNWLRVGLGGLAIKTQFWAGVSVAVGAAGWAMMMASRYLHCAHPGFSLQCYWLIPQFTKKNINYAQSKLCEAGRCWIELVVPSWSGLCFRLCKLHSLEQLTLLSHGCIWPRYNTAEKLCFECYFNHNSFWVDTFSPPNPSWFILGHPELRFIMFSVVHILLCYKNKWKYLLP